MASHRRFGLHAALTLPVMALVVAVMLALFVVEEWASHQQVNALLDRRAETVGAGITSRLEERRRQKIALVKMLTREPELPELVAQRDLPGVARLLVPLKATLEFGFIRVLDAQGQGILTIGSADDTAHMGIVRHATIGITESTVTVEANGMQVAAAAPIKGPSGIVGTLVVGSFLNSQQLALIRDYDDIELLVVRGDTVVASSSMDDRLAWAVERLGGQTATGSMLDDALTPLGYHAANRQISDGGSLVVLIPTNDILAATRQRTVTIMVGLLAVVSIIAVGGLIAARKLSSTLNEMMQAAISISEGRYGQRIHPSRIREFDIVGRTINNLAGQVEEQLRELTYRAFYDRLTDLPNRALLKDRLRLATMRSRRRPGHVAVMFLDLDNFKIVNDSLGHETGDALLVALADRLRQSVRPEDTVARLGGDEFVVLVEEVEDEQAARVIAARILDHLTQPYQIDGHCLFSMASIGIALSTLEEDNPDDLMRNADVAMYHAKNAGKGRFMVFEPSMNAYAVERLALETDLRGALDRGEIHVAYQPIVCLGTGRLIEVEALMRWEHPTRGEISPVEFIPIAEETGMIVPLGAWVLREAARRGREWHDAHPESPIVLGVNLSARQFQQPTLVADIARILAEEKLDPHLLKLEITESVMMHDVDAAVTILNQLKKTGIQLAIDDFGTGYSSLAQLRRLPVDILKIDRAFVCRLEEDPEDEAIVRSIISLADSLNLAVTGEGIETAEQAGHLRDLGCEQGQGFFYAHPMDPDDIDQMLSTVQPTLPIARADADRPKVSVPAVPAAQSQRPVAHVRRAS